MTTIEEKNDGQILKVDCIGRVKTPPEMREQLLDLFEQVISEWYGKKAAAREDSCFYYLS